MSFSIYTSIRILLDPNSSIDYSSIVHISIPVIGGHTFWHGGRIVFFFSCETGNRRYSYHGNAHQAVGIPVVDSGHILSGHIVGSYRVRVRHLTSHILAHRQFRCGNMTQAPILKLANPKPSPIPDPNLNPTLALELVRGKGSHKSPYTLRKVIWWGYIAIKVFDSREYWYCGKSLWRMRV